MFIHVNYELVTLQLIYDFVLTVNYYFGILYEPVSNIYIERLRPRRDLNTQPSDGLETKWWAGDGGRPAKGSSVIINTHN